MWFVNHFELRIYCLKGFKGKDDIRIIDSRMIKDELFDETTFVRDMKKAVNRICVIHVDIVNKIGIIAVKKADDVDKL